MIEMACKYDKPVRIGVNWGSLDQDLLARIMDENARRPQPLDATEMMRHAMVASALESAARAEELGLAGAKIILSCKVSGVQDLIAIYRELAQRARLSAAPRPDRSRHGLQGHRRVDRGAVGAAAGRHRRHHPHFADAGTRRFAHAGSHRRPGNPADHGLARLHADGRGLSGLRPDDQHLLPGTGRRGPGIRARPDAGVEAALRRRREHDAGRHGLRRQWPRREQACQHRHLAAGYRRGAVGAGLRGRREDGHAAGATTSPANSRPSSSATSQRTYKKKLHA